MELCVGAADALDCEDVAPVHGAERRKARVGRLVHHLSMRILNLRLLTITSKNREVETKSKDEKPEKTKPSIQLDHNRT